MEELRLIVDELNKAPFSKGLTLVTLDEKAPAELLQIVVDVLAEMDPNQKKDVRHSDRDDVVYAIVDFVTMLNYKPALDNKAALHQQFLNGWPLNAFTSRSDIAPAMSR